MSVWNHIQEDIFNTTGMRVRDARESVGGGCINQTLRLAGDGRDFFVKFNAAEKSDMFVAEAEGLRALAATQTVRVPEAVCWGVADDAAFLVLEHLKFGRANNGAMLGEQLAMLHRSTQADFGWQRDNTIGVTLQRNAPDADWINFWRMQRLGFQLTLAQRNGYAGRLQVLGEQLQARLEEFFVGYRPQPSLLHGDLWSGNHAYLVDGTPVIFDPAVYYGDREADLAMSELFGGFGAAFYAAYRGVWPLDVGYATRKNLYNLYHILNHLNMFGGGYERQALNLLQQLLAELR